MVKNDRYLFTGSHFTSIKFLTFSRIFSRLKCYFFHAHHFSDCHFPDWWIEITRKRLTNWDEKIWHTEIMKWEKILSDDIPFFPTQTFKLQTFEAWKSLLKFPTFSRLQHPVGTLLTVYYQSNTYIFFKQNHLFWQIKDIVMFCLLQSSTLIYDFKNSGEKRGWDHELY